MSPDLDALLCHRYPRIFARRRESAAVTAMGRGIACDDGWFDLIDELCSKLQAAVEHRRIPQPVAEQVKEKLGELRFYASPKSLESRRLVDEARERSLVICEVCGEPGFLRRDAGIKTLCGSHAPPSSTRVSRETSSS